MKPVLPLLLVLLLCALATPSSAQRIGIYPDPQGSSSCIEAETGKPLNLYVVVLPIGGDTTPFSAVRFHFYYGYCGVFLHNFVPVFPATTLDLGVVFNVDFGGCLSLPQHVLTVEAFGYYPGNCCFIGMEAVSATDCSGNEVDMADGRFTLVDTLCTVIAPSNPYPADGAGGVPRSVILTWDEMKGPNYCSTIPNYVVYFGTTPDPPLVTMGGDTSYDPPGSLRENTTYYWRVAGIWGGGASSPLWTFSTGAPVSVAPSTWGRIKALYR